MKRIAFHVAIVAATAAAPACANTGIGILVPWIPAAVIALLPAIVVEAFLLARVLPERLPRSLWISTVANVASTLAGALIAVVLDIAILASLGISGAEPGRGPLLVALVPMFFVTWWLETLAVRWMQPVERKQRARRAALVANAASYALMAICVALFVPPAGSRFSRWSLSEALNDLGAAKTLVSEEFLRTKAMPAPRDMPVSHASVKGIRLESGGRLVMTLSFPGQPEGDGKHVVYEPRVANGVLVDWRCTSPDIEPKYLPANCRL